MKKFIFVLMLVVCTAVHAELIDDLISYVKFDQTFVDGVKVKDEMGGFGDYTTDDGNGSTTGKFNGAVYFAGKAGDIINMGEYSACDPNESSFSISVWFRLGSTITYQSLVRKGARTSTMVGYGLATTSAGSTRSIHYRLNGDTTTRIDKVVSWTADTGVWHHLCLVVDRTVSTAYLYLDGAILDSSDISAVGDIRPTGEPLTLGALLNTTGITFGMEGALDEFAYWGRALSAEEIGSLYNDGAGLEITGFATVLSADLNSDGWVDLEDFALFAAQWLTAGAV